MEALNKYLFTWFFLGLFTTSCNAQTKSNTTGKDPAGGEEFHSDLVKISGSQFRYYGIDKTVSATDTSPGWTEKAQKILLTGIVYQRDGRTPAANILLYYYQTNPDGRYLHNPAERRSMAPNKLGQTHGYIRGWVKTNADGQYFIYTVRPGTYPTNDEPAHVHVTVKEPNEIKEYFIDDFVFDDDKLLTSARRQKFENRGGSGILRMVESGNLQIGERNIILGLNIPNYPAYSKNEPVSGNSIGEDVFSFTPFHAWGPDKGTKTCPVCKYGWYHGILYFVGNNPDWSSIREWLRFLESESFKRRKYLKVYFIYGNEIAFDKSTREKELEQIGQELQLEQVALTFVSSFSDTFSDIHLNNINPDVRNTIILYKRSRIIDKFVNLEPNEENFKRVVHQLDRSINRYFDLPRPEKE